jgi:1-acyl-sn-glycerol-3-phosphate acyltransferase
MALNALSLGRSWRLVVTGACFLLFSVGGLALSLTLFPLVLLVSADARQGQRRVRWLICAFFRALVAVLRATGVMRLEARGVEQLREAGAVLVLANHPSYIDVVVLLSLMPQATCVVKSDLWRNPFFAGVVSAAGYVRNASPEEVIAQCERALGAGQAVIVFPEGTRTRPNAPLKFLRGAAHIALKSGRPIVPVLLQCDPPTLAKGSRWYDIPACPFRFGLTVRAELCASELADLCQPPVIAARRLTHALESYFSKELRAL